MHPSLERAIRLSQLMQYALLALGAVIAASALFVIVKSAFDRPWLEAIIAARYDMLGAAQISAWQLVLLGLVFLAQIALTLLALRALWKAFGSIAGEGICPNTALWIRKSGMLFAFLTLANVLSHPLNSFFVSINALPGHRLLSVAFGSEEILSFLMAAVLIVLGHVLMLAADIDEDHRQII